MDWARSMALLPWSGIQLYINSVEPMDLKTLSFRAPRERNWRTENAKYALKNFEISSNEESKTHLLWCWYRILHGRSFSLRFFFHQTHNLNSWFQESVTRMNLSLIHIYIQMNLISVDGSEEKSGKEVLRKPMEVCHDIVISSTHTHIGLIRLTNKSSTRIIIIIVMECHREQCSSNE